MVVEQVHCQWGPRKHLGCRGDFGTKAMARDAGFAEYRLVQKKIGERIM